MVLSKVPGRDKFIIWMALAFGAFGWVLHSQLIFDAFISDTEVHPKWITSINYNFYGEGIYELVLFPAIALFIIYGFYLYAKDIV